MKKKIVGLFLIGMCFFGIQNIHAEEITLNKVADSFKKKIALYDSNQQSDVKLDINVTTTDSSIIVDYKQDYGNKVNTYQTIFNYSDGKISYTSPFLSITTEEEANKTFVDMIWIENMVWTIAEEYGYDLNCWGFAGLPESKKINVVYGDPVNITTEAGGSVSGTPIQYFEISLIDDPFTMYSKTCTEEKQQLANSTNTQKTVQKEVKKVEKNPNTGDSKMIFIVAILVIGISGLTLKRIKQL